MATVTDIHDALTTWGLDFEIIVVNDGSTDRTGDLLKALTTFAPQVRLVNHAVNQGYGAALVSGFAAASKELTFFMDSDGQFTIADLAAFFEAIDDHTAVIGYRIARQDTWMRRLNAWGWKWLIRLVLGVGVRDIDCAFKLLHTAFLQQHPLETRGAMINAELLFKLKRSGGTYREIGVHHLPRTSGRATGANLRVILRAFRELFTSARKWRQEGGVAPVSQPAGAGSVAPTTASAEVGRSAAVPGGLGGERSPATSFDPEATQPHQPTKIV